MNDMHKRGWIILCLLLSLSIFSFSFISLIKAETPATPGEAVKQQLGFNPEDLPTTPQEIKDKYLSQEWSDLISNNTYLGPIHKTFVANPTIFKIIFGDPYAISLTFLLILILWLFIGAQSGRLLEASGLLKGGSAILAGFIFTILLAQTTLLRSLAKLCLDIVTQSANWWIRLIVGIVIVVLFFILSYLVSLTRKSMIEKRKKKREEKLDEKTEEVEEIEKGLKE